jgi:glucose-specific phosphotransferase system IIA component
MNLFHKIKKAIVKKLVKRILHRFKESHDQRKALAARQGKVFAPVGGRVLPMADVPDDIFGQGDLGDGCGIWPDAAELVSPVDGTVSATMPLEHMVGITSDDGIEVLLHVGHGTRDDQSTGFERLVEKGQHVEVGTRVMTFPHDAGDATGSGHLVVVAIPNSADYASVALLATEAVSVGQPLLEATAKRPDAPSR